MPRHTRSLICITPTEVWLYDNKKVSFCPFSMNWRKQLSCQAMATIIFWYIHGAGRGAAAWQTTASEASASTALTRSTYPSDILLRHPPFENFGKLRRLLRR